MDNTKLRQKLKKGQIIYYRSKLVKIIKVNHDGCTIGGPYGNVQDINWKDIRQYNHEFQN